MDRVVSMQLITFCNFNYIAYALQNIYSKYFISSFFRLLKLNVHYFLFHELFCSSM